MQLKACVLAVSLLAICICRIYAIGCPGIVSFMLSDGSLRVTSISGAGKPSLGGIMRDIALWNCSSAIFARNSEFCCALRQRGMISCGAWTKWSVEPVVPAYFNFTIAPSFVWPPDTLITTIPNKTVDGSFFLAMFSKRTDLGSPLVIFQPSGLPGNNSAIFTESNFALKTLFSSGDDAISWLNINKEEDSSLVMWDGDSIPFDNGRIAYNNDGEQYAVTKDSIWSDNNENRQQILKTVIPLQTGKLILDWTRMPLGAFKINSIYSTNLNCPAILASVNTTGFRGENAKTNQLGFIDTKTLRFMSIYDSPLPIVAATYSAFVPEGLIECPGPSPGPSFVCINGTWVSDTSVATPTIIVSGAVVILGNLSAGTSTTISGLGSTLYIDNCASIGGEIVLLLTPAELESIINKGGTQVTLIASKNCSLENLASVPASISSNGKKRCEKVSIKTKVTPDKRSLTAVLTVDKLPCKLWWIILLSVLGGLILISVITLALVFTFSSKARKLVRPFSTRRQPAGAPK